MIKTGAITTRTGWLRRLRIGVMAVILLDLLLIGGQLAVYQPLLAQPGALNYVLEPVVLLLAYAAATLWITGPANAARHVALREGTLIGLIGGMLFIVNLASETFLDLAAPANLFATAPFFLGTFALWGVAGYRSARCDRLGASRHPGSDLERHVYHPAHHHLRFHPGLYRAPTAGAESRYLA